MLNDNSSIMTMDPNLNFQAKSRFDYTSSKFFGQKEKGASLKKMSPRDVRIQSKLQSKIILDVPSEENLNSSFGFDLKNKDLKQDLKMNQTFNTINESDDGI